MYLNLRFAVYPIPRTSRPADGLTADDYQTLEQFIRLRDIFIVPVGGRSMADIRRTVRDIKVVFPRNRVDVHCSIQNLNETLINIPHDVNGVYVDYEKSTCEDAGLEWPREDWDQVLTQVTALVHKVRRAAFKGCLTYPGSPFNPAQVPDFWGWHFPTLDELTDGSLAMMQGVADRGLFQQSVERMRDAYGVNHLQGNGYILTLDGGNEIPLEEAVRCIEWAHAVGITDCWLWGRTLSEMREALHQLRDPRLTA